MFPCAVLAALGHLLLDYTTAYGIRLFEPFNFRWYSWDLVFIVEPVMLLALVAGLVLPSLGNLINQEIGARSKGPRGRAGAIFALVCLVLVWGVRGWHRTQPRCHCYEFVPLPWRRAAAGRGLSVHDQSLPLAWSVEAA